jgi:hypothetical protein
MECELDVSVVLDNILGKHHPVSVCIVYPWVKSSTEEMS